MNFKPTLFSILFFLILGFSAQAQSEKRIGAFLAYGSEIENIGIGANAEFPLIENLTLAPSVIYYFPKDTYGLKMNWLEVNVNANYYFLTQENLGVYGIGGLNYSSVKVKYDGAYGWGSSGDYSTTDGRFGLNLGAGANFSIGGNILPFAEIKYVIIDGGQLVVGAGIKFKL